MIPTPTRCAVLLLLAVTSAAVSPAAAQQQKSLADRVLSRPETPRPRDCRNANMVELGQCAIADFRQADKALNAAYNQARGDSRNDALRALLLESQRAWLRLRDANCDFESGVYEGGSMAGLAAVNCLLRMTRERATYLEHAFDP